MYTGRLVAMVFIATFNNISFIYRGGLLYWWRKLKHSEKTSDLLQITDTVSPNVVSSTLRHVHDSN